MARYTDSVCRLCRAEGTKLFLKGERCNTGKCAIVRRSYRPGQHGQARQKLSEYGLRLREKQKLRRIYGVIETQFRRYYEQAARKKGVTGERMLQLLESRLDNVVYRLGFATSRAQARQVVRHGHILVDGRRLDIPSAQVKPGNVLTVTEKTQDAIRNLQNLSGPVLVPSWLSVNQEALSGQVLSLPRREEIDTSIQENLVIEFYAR